MSVVRSAPEVKYELLSHTSQVHHPRWKEYGAIFVCLLTLISVSYLTLYLAWGHLDEDQVDNLDFVMYGPRRTPLSVIQRVQERRSGLYAKANYDFVQTLHTASQSEAVASLQSILLQNNPNIRSTPQPDGFKLVCYYHLPSKLDPLFNELMPENLNASLCTHINIAFAFISSNNTLQPSSDNDTKYYERVVKLKDQNPNLKVLLSVNGDMKSVVVNHTTRKVFIRSCLATLKLYDFDGVDIDWEFPDSPWNFTTLLAELRNAMGSRYLLTTAVAAPQPIVDLSYKINIMARYVDWVNLMAYDFHHFTRYTPWTGINAPLYGAQNEQGYLAQLNTNWSAHYWESQGMPRNKIVIGIPTYGHSFTLVNEDNDGIGAPASSVGDIGTGGFVKYPDVCQFLSSGAKSISDRSTRSPYAIRGQTWISFDDERSVAYKAEFVTEKGYSGVMVWSLNADDFNGSCYNSGVQYPLVKRIKNVLTDDQL